MIKNICLLFNCLFLISIYAILFKESLMHFLSPKRHFLQRVNSFERSTNVHSEISKKSNINKDSFLLFVGASKRNLNDVQEIPMHLPVVANGVCGFLSNCPKCLDFLHGAIVQQIQNVLGHLRRRWCALKDAT